MRISEVTECFDLPGPTSESALVGKAIDDLGIDKVSSDLYHCVVETECGTGGIRNLNNRIYVPEEVAEQHLRLSADAQTRFIEGLKGHPDQGAGWNIPVRFLGGEVVENVDGSVTSRGRFGILKTTDGNDVHTLWRAGFPIGVSLRGLCYMTEAQLEKDSPFAEANPDAIGEMVTFCTGLRLEKYDLVRRASAGSYFPTSEEAREALMSVTESGVLPPEPINKPGEIAEEDVMELKDLLEKYPEHVATIRSEAVENARVGLEKEAAEGNPLASASDEEKALVARVLEAVKPGDENKTEAVTQALEAIRVQGGANQTRLTELEESLKARTAEVKEQREAFDALKAELAAEKLQTAIRNALEAKSVGVIAGDRVSTFVLGQFAKGRVTSVEEAGQLFDEVNSLNSAEAVAAQATQESASAGGTVDATDTDSKNAEEAAAPKAKPAPEGPPGLLGATTLNPIAAAIRLRRAG